MNLNGHFITKQEFLLRMQKGPSASALVYHAARYIDHSPSLLKQSRIYLLKRTKQRF